MWGRRRYLSSGTALGSASLETLYIQEKIALGLDFSDLSSVYLDDQAIGGPVTADGDTVGGAFNHALWGGKTMNAFIASQPALEEDDFNYASDAALRAVWAGVDGGISDISDPTVLTNPSPGVMRVTNNNASNAYARGVLALTGLTVGQAYVAAVTMVQQSSTPGAHFTINPDPDGSGVGQPYAASYNLSSAEDGTEATIIFVAPNTTMYAGCWVNIPGNAEWAEWSSFSLKALPGNHFLQSDTAKELTFKKRLKADADLSGQAELVTDGDFSEGITQVTAYRNASLQDDGGVLRVTNGASSEGQGHLAIPTSVGAAYYLTFDVTGGTANGVVRAYRNDHTTALNSVAAAVSGSYEMLFFAQDTTSHISLGVNAAGAGAYTQFDNVYVKEVPASQLYNVLYSGGVDEIMQGQPFAANQAGGAVFVFGIKGSPQTTRTIYAEGNSSDNDPLYWLRTDNSTGDKLAVQIRNDAGGALLLAESTIAILDGDPHVVAFQDVQVSGSNYAWSMWVDGQDAGSGTYTRSGSLTMDIASVMALKRISESNWLAGDLSDRFLVGKPIMTLADIRVATAAIAADMGVSLS